MHVQDRNIVAYYYVNLRRHCTMKRGHYYFANLSAYVDIGFKAATKPPIPCCLSAI